MANQDPPVGRLEKLGYGVGDLASSLYINFFNIYLLYYFVELGGVGPAAMGLMLLLTKFFDAITDPVMGAIGDRTRTRWGRYRPYLLWGAVPFGLFGAAIFAAPELTPGSMLVWAYVTYTLTMVAFTATNVPYSALMGVISPSADTRSSVAAYRMIFSALAVVGVAVVATTLVRELGAGDERRGIMLTMFVLAGAGMLALVIAFASTRERIPPAPTNGRIRDDIGLLIRTPAWIAVAAAAVLTPVALASRASSALFWFRYVAGDDGRTVFLFLDRARRRIAGPPVRQGAPHHRRRHHRSRRDQRVSPDAGRCSLAADRRAGLRRRRTGHDDDARLFDVHRYRRISRMVDQAADDRSCRIGRGLRG